MIIMKYLLLFGYGVLSAVITLGISIFSADTATAGSDFPLEGITTNGSFLNNSDSSETELPRGVPFIANLVYEQNNSFLTSGAVDYFVKFDFNEAFQITDAIPGTFSSATIINDTVKFHGGPISKGENKTGIIILNFKDGLAEKHRSGVVTTNVTVQGSEETIRGLALSKDSTDTNSSGTFATTSLFSNESLTSALIGARPQEFNPNLVNNIPIDVLESNLNNLTLSEISGTFNVLQPSRADDLIGSLPPLFPSNTISHTTSLEVNSSIAEFITVIVNLSNNILDTADRWYVQVTPCLSLQSLEQSGQQDIPGASLYKFLLEIRNCSTHPELIRMVSQGGPSFNKFFNINRFDLVSNETKQIEFLTLIPNVTTPGLYVVSVEGQALYNAFGRDVIVTITNGTASFVFQGQNRQ